MSSVPVHSFKHAVRKAMEVGASAREEIVAAVIRRMSDEIIHVATLGESCAEIRLDESPGFDRPILRACQERLDFTAEVVVHADRSGKMWRFLRVHFENELERAFQKE